MGHNPKILKRESPQLAASPHPISLPQSQFPISSFYSGFLLSILLSLPLPLSPLLHHRLALQVSTSLPRPCVRTASLPVSLVPSLPPIASSTSRDSCLL